MWWNFFRICPLCREPREADSGLCRGCGSVYRSPSGPRCEGCGGELISEQHRCWTCRSERISLSGAAGLFPYRSWGGTLLRLYKFEGYKGLARTFARWMLPLFEGPGPLVPVPPGRRGSRFYEPVLELTKALSRLTGRQVLRGLIRTTPRSQKRLDRESRALGDWEGLRWTGGPLPRRLFLVDDVITTGATIQSCSQVLREAGVDAVVVRCVCLR